MSALSKAEPPSETRIAGGDTIDVINFCKDVQTILSTQGVRGYIDDRNETIGRKIRDTELKKVPYMLIVGDKEMETGMVAVRRQGHGDQGATSIEDFAALIKAQE